MLCKMTASTSWSEKDTEDILAIAEKIRQMINEAFRVGSKTFFGNMLGPFGILAFWLFGKQVINVQLRLDELLEGMLKEHEDEIERKDTEDFMDILLNVYQDDKARVKMTRTNLKALIADVFVGSTGTSSEVILWTIAELINHPSVFDKVRDEINSVVDSTSLVEESDVANLPYLQAVVKETPQLYPPLPVTTRKCRQRRRACLGSNLVLSMAHIAVATLVQCFDWKVVGDGEEAKAKVNIEVTKGAFIHTASSST
ncbi:cytochrome p450 705a5 [Quercus suber]|uniref:Cytochrome p450 705a5 n=1 Tax=Quercus suber TaxID=58331 RepID=A0AAW0L6W1_QUESU